MLKCCNTEWLQECGRQYKWVGLDHSNSGDDRYMRMYADAKIDPSAIRISATVEYTW